MMASPAIPRNSPEQQQIVLILGGWSPGPLYYLEPFLQNELGLRLVRLPIEMPPVTWGWCFRSWRRSLLLFVVYGGFLWLVRWFRQNSSSGWVGFVAVSVTLMGTLLWLRMVVALAVHASMQYNVGLCRRYLDAHNNNVVLMTGFSWGGAVLAEFLAADTTSSWTRSGTALLEASDDHNPHHENATTMSPACLLMAPTTAVVARLNLFQPRDAAMRFSSSSTASVVAVVHATADPIFCPHPERWREQPVEFTILRDNHVLMRSASERRLRDAVTWLVQRRRQSSDS